MMDGHMMDAATCSPFPKASRSMWQIVHIMHTIKNLSRDFSRSVAGRMLI